MSLFVRLELSLGDLMHQPHFLSLCSDCSRGVCMWQRMLWVSCVHCQGWSGTSLYCSSTFKAQLATSTKKQLGLCAGLQATIRHASLAKQALLLSISAQTSAPAATEDLPGSSDDADSASTTLCQARIWGVYFFFSHLYSPHRHVLVSPAQSGGNLPVGKVWVLHHLQHGLW